MATTEVELCNLALFRVRAGEIGDLNEQSPNAEKCRVLYPQARDTVLTSFPWSFAKSVKALSQRAETPTEWEYLFDYPNDALAIRYLIPVDSSGESAFYFQNLHHDQQPIEFEVMLDSNGDKSIATNYEYIKACYTKNITDVALWDNLVDDLIAWRLAMDLAIPLGGDSAKQYRAEAERQFAILESRAKARTGNERWPRLGQQKPKNIQARGETILSRDELIYRRGY